MASGNTINGYWRSLWWNVLLARLVPITEYPIDSQLQSAFLSVSEHVADAALALCSAGGLPAADMNLLLEVRGDFFGSPIYDEPMVRTVMAVNRHSPQVVSVDLAANDCFLVSLLPWILLDSKAIVDTLRSNTGASEASQYYIAFWTAISSAIAPCYRIGDEYLAIVCGAS